MMRWLLVVALTGCVGSSAEWRPAKGSGDLPAQKTAYRVHGDPGCTHIGFVTHARSIESLADAVAEHGGTHFVVLDDFSHDTVETDSTATAAGNAYLAVANGHSSSEVVTHHAYTADAFVCSR